jgi:hypothetical protein
MLYPDPSTTTRSGVGTSRPSRTPTDSPSRAGSASSFALGWFYGPGARHSEEFFALARGHVCVTMGSPSTYVSSIHLSDAGDAVVAPIVAALGSRQPRRGGHPQRGAS